MSRLRTIIDLIPQTARVVVDIGYDHGHLLAKLARSRPGVGLLGVELQERSSAFFAQLQTAAVRERVGLRTGSGLAPLTANDRVDTVVIAGMGEHLIASLIRDAAPDVLAGVETLVLCPADFRHVLRPALQELGWRSVADRVAQERGRHYEVMRCRRIVAPLKTDATGNTTTELGTGLTAPDATRDATPDATFFGTLQGAVLLGYCQALTARHRGALNAPATADTPILSKLRRAAAIVGRAQAPAIG